jgi:hypothetical protein
MAMADLRQAFLALQEGRFADAETLSRSILARSPSQWSAYIVLTDSLLRQGNVAAADSLTAPMIGNQPRQPDLLVARAMALTCLSRPADALDLLDQALELRLSHPIADQLLCDLLAQRKDPQPRYRVTVITPSIGTQYLPQAVESVQAQSYPLVEHLVVADGPEHHRRVSAMLPANPRHPIQFLPLPLNVGAGGFNGHRVYAAAPFLVHSRFVAFLDEDNWFDPDHLESLMGPITAQGLSWAYALRKIVGPDGRFLANDDCESLGEWATWNQPDVHLVDVNCYVLRRDLAMAASPLWYRRFRDEESPDFALCRMLLNARRRCTTNGRYTVNYRVGRSPGSVQAEFFRRGNAVMLERNAGRFPWRRASPDR